MSYDVFNKSDVCKIIQQNDCAAVKRKTSLESPSSQLKLLDINYRNFLP